MAEPIVSRNPNDARFTIARVVWTLLWIVEVILGLRFVLRLIGANPAAGFTDFVYSLSRPLVDPFLNVVRSSTTGTTTGSVFEWSTLIALVVYWIVAWAIVRLMALANPTDRSGYIDRNPVEPTV